MGKWFGKIGFGKSKETSLDVWTDEIIEREYIGEVYSRYSRLESRENSSEDINDDVLITNSISIIADPFAEGNFSRIRYLEFMGVKWKVSKVTVQFPRLLLDIGGVWNE